MKRCPDCTLLNQRGVASPFDCVACAKIDPTLKTMQTNVHSCEGNDDCPECAGAVDHDAPQYTPGECRFCHRKLQGSQTACWQWACVEDVIARLRMEIVKQQGYDTYDVFGMKSMREAKERAERDLRKALLWLTTTRLDPTEALWVERRRKELGNG